MKKNCYFKRYIICLILFICSGIVALFFLNKCRILKQQYYYEARTDYLTEIPNRRAFYEDVKKLFENGKKAIIPLTAILLDIDHFKNINDEYGYDTADSILTILGKKIKGHMRISDLFARLGGDEFGILMPNTNTPDALSIMSAIKSDFSIETKNIINQPITFSAGMVTFSEEPPAIEKIFQRAEFYLHSAKQEPEGTIKSGVS